MCYGLQQEITSIWLAQCHILWQWLLYILSECFCPQWVLSPSGYRTPFTGPWQCIFCSWSMKDQSRQLQTQEPCPTVCSMLLSVLVSYWSLGNNSAYPYNHSFHLCVDGLLVWVKGKTQTCSQMIRKGRYKTSPLQTHGFQNRQTYFT